MRQKSEKLGEMREVRLLRVERAVLRLGWLCVCVRSDEVTRIGMRFNNGGFGNIGPLGSYLCSAE